MAARNWTGKWAGGRTFRDAQGKTRWILERMVDGRRFARTLEVKSEDEALAEAALFDRDPEAYATKSQTKAEAAANALIIHKESVAKVLAYLEKEGRTPKYVADTQRYLGDWAEDLEGDDLRKQKLKDLLTLLNARPTAKQKRVAALKTFTAYFREQEASLAVGEDPTVALMSIQVRPEKLVREKGYTMEHIEKLYRGVYAWENDRTEADRFGRTRPLGANAASRREAPGDPQLVRDYLRLRAMTGMHHSEIDRLATGGGHLEPVKHPRIAGTLKFIHKSGRVHHVSVDAPTFAAALRIQARGEALSESYLRATIKYAAKKAEVETINPSELRHSFTTWASEQGEEVKPKQGGVSLEAIAAVLGHQSTRTSGFFYLGSKVPAMIAVPLKLFHPEDPRGVPVVKKAAKLAASKVAKIAA